MKTTEVKGFTQKALCTKKLNIFFFDACIFGKNFKYCASVI